MMKTQNWILVIGLLVILIVGCAPVEKQGPKGQVESNKILFYRNPMDPQVTSPRPMKDQMGMDYIPVYEEEAIRSKEEAELSGEANIVRLTQEEERMIEVKTSPVSYRKLTKEIRAVGSVAYDPDLYVAQEEFIGSLDLNDESLIAAARQRLRILGMSEAQIADLKENGEPQANLILPEGKAWVYANFYEYEAGWLKIGQKAVVRALVAPGEDFSGELMAIEPIVKQMTRTIQAKIEVDNPSLTLKPNMYVDVYLRAELPKAVLAIPSEAILDTGARKLVYVDKGQGIYVGREVKVGLEASGYYPVISGISVGDRVVSKANFLIDSQSKLTGQASSVYGSAAKEIKTEHKH